MTVHQNPWEVRAFAQYLRDLGARLEPGQGWYGVFCARDPDGMRACFDGSEVPPWDVVESLLQDLATLRGTESAAQESVHAAQLCAAASAAYDRRPGGRQALVDRLGVMLQEQSYAARRMRAAGADGAPAPEGDTEVLAWARDDHARATARCAELRGRLAAVERTVPDSWFRGQGDASAPAPARSTPTAPGSGPEPVSTPAPRPGPAKKRRKPGGARFAGLEIEEGAEAGPDPSEVPALPVAAQTDAVPRGARFSGSQAEGGAGPAALRAAEPDPAARRAAEDAVALLVRLRAEGRSGEAHAVLCEAAAWPAGHLPVLAVALHGAGLDADWATLLWEASSLPPAELAASAGALAAAGRADDCGQLLRQGVARPADEIADAVVALDLAGLEPEARALLGAYVRVRTPEDAARVAEGRPRHLVPRLLAAAREVSEAREWDVVHALRVAGIAAP
uniref:UL36 very large tegument protein n=1 Tax=Streptomyces sp. NBC_01401 TaxID=2903854 RepID=A0AAU3H3S6_9ACTN